MNSNSLRSFACILAACLIFSACAPAPTPTAAPTDIPATTAASMSASMSGSMSAGTSMAASSAASPSAAKIDCMGAAAGDTLTVVYQWSGNEEESFNTVIKPFEDACGVKITAQSTRDDAVLDTLVKSTPPDVLFWPTLSPLKLYTDKLMPLDSVGANKDNYASYWIDMGTSGGKWLALPAKADVKSIIWYSPAQFAALNYKVPTTLDELKTLASKMAADGNVPWSMGFNNGGAGNGWAGTDFIQDILLSTQGPAYVNKILSGQVPYNDPPVIDAYKLYYSWASDPKYAVGGANGTVNTKFLDSIYKVFSNPPEAMMVKISGFAGGEIVKQYPTLKYGTDFDFFEFPGVQGVQGSADFMYAFSNKPAAKALIAYITSTDGGAAWAKAGFGLSPNKGASGNYPDAQSTKLGGILAGAAGFTFDIGDGLGAPFSDAEFKGVNDIVQGAEITATLATVAAAQAQTVKK